MGKRFTATEKWDDKWFRNLTPNLKLAYFYLLDSCDIAGVIELDTDLAEFKIGAKIDWDALERVSEGRIERLPNGRLWLTKFIEFQCGELKETCQPHRAVMGLMVKHGITARVMQGYVNSGRTHKEKEQDKDREEDLEEGCGEKPALIEVIDWWNALKADGLVPAGASRKPVSEAVKKGWSRVEDSALLREKLADRERLTDVIRRSSFCRDGWFRLEKLLGGKNRDGEYIIVKLLDEGYVDDHKTAASPKSLAQIAEESFYRRKMQADGNHPTDC